MFFMSHAVVKVSHLSAAPQSRWHIFRLVRVRHVTCGCQGVSPFGSPPVKMAHLSTGSCSSCHMWLSRCLTFRQPPVKMAHLSTGSCSSCHMWLSRCLTFRQPPSQDGTSFDWFVFVMSHVVVKVSHLSAAPQSRWHIFRLVRVRHVTCGCQGVSPFGSPQSRWHIFRLVRVRHVTCGLSRCLTFRQPPSQDGTSFDWFVFVMSHVVVKVSHVSAAPQSRWHIFRLVHVRHVTCGCQGVSPFGSPPVKMAHLSTGSCSSCHMWLSRCLIFRQPPVINAHDVSFRSSS